MKNVQQSEDGGQNKTDRLVTKVLSSLCSHWRGRGGFFWDFHFLKAQIQKERVESGPRLLPDTF